MAIALDLGSNSGVKASVSSFTWSHTLGTLTNGFIGVMVISRGGASLNTDCNVSSVSVGSLSLTKAVERNNGDVAANVLCTSLWQGVAPASGAQTITVTFQGTALFTVGYAISLSGVAQSSPVDVTNSSTALAQASPDTTSLTTLTNNCWLIDGIYNKIGTALTPGTSQTKVAAETFPNGGGDTADASYKGPVTPAGSTSMSWTFTGSDDYCQAVMAVKPFVAASNLITRMMMGVGV